MVLSSVRKYCSSSSFRSSSYSRDPYSRSSSYSRDPYSRSPSWTRSPSFSRSPSWKRYYRSRTSSRTRSSSMGSYDSCDWEVESDDSTLYLSEEDYKKINKFKVVRHFKKDYSDNACFDDDNAEIVSDIIEQSCFRSRSLTDRRSAFWSTKRRRSSSCYPGSCNTSTHLMDYNCDYFLSY